MPVLSHWRIHQGAEVDLIISARGRLYPIEVKSSHVSGHDTRGIQAFRKAYPNENIARNPDIYTGHQSYRINEYASALAWNACV